MFRVSFSFSCPLLNVDVELAIYNQPVSQNCFFEFNLSRPAQSCVGGRAGADLVPPPLRVVAPLS